MNELYWNLRGKESIKCFCFIKYSFIFLYRFSFFDHFLLFVHVEKCSNVWEERERERKQKRMRSFDWKTKENFSEIKAFLATQKAVLIKKLSRKLFVNCSRSFLNQHSSKALHLVIWASDFYQNCYFLYRCRWKSISL